MDYHDDKDVENPEGNNILEITQGLHGPLSVFGKIWRANLNQLISRMSKQHLSMFVHEKLSPSQAG